MTADVVRVSPGALAGTVRLPGDKSLSHRALLIGALVGAPVEVHGVATSGDAASMAACLRTLGVDVDLEPGADGGLDGMVSGPLHEPVDVLDCGNAGTAMRLLAGAVAGVRGLSVLTGDASLRGRPMGRVLEPLRDMGAGVDGRDGGRVPPITIRGGHLDDIHHHSNVASAQVKSVLVLAGVSAAVEVTVTSPLPSRDHTERMLAHLGGDVVRTIGADESETVRMAPRPLTARAVGVSRDPSAAAFWLVAAAVAGTSIVLPGVCVNPGRTGALDVLAELGLDVRRDDARDVAGEPVADLVVASGGLDGGAVVSGRTVVDAIDELPVLAIAGACSRGGLVVHDAGEMRVKESDRIAALEHVFDELGLQMTSSPDGFVVPGGQSIRGGGTVDAGHDHRIAMTAAVAATVAQEPVTIRGFRSVPTSYPGFLADIQALGGHIDVLEVAT